jgi:membrane associated rhomboid family serine protease
LCGLTAAAGQIIMEPTSLLPTIGASGAIAGVMGAYFVLYPRSRVLTLIPIFLFDIIELPAIVLLGFWFLMQLFNAGAVAVTASTDGGGVAFAAHVAGFIVGILGVFVFRKREQREAWDA